MDEKVFYTKNDVTVTNSRFIAGAKTYTMSGVTSIKLHKEDEPKTGPFITLGIGLVLFFAHKILISVLLIAGAIYWFKSQKPTFYVVLTTSAGEEQGLKSKDKEYIASVIAALNDAIVHRG